MDQRMRSSGGDVQHVQTSGPHVAKVRSFDEAVVELTRLFDLREALHQDWTEILRVAAMLRRQQDESMSRFERLVQAVQFLGERI